MVDGTRVDDLDALPTPILRDDRMIIGRGGVAYRADMSNLRGSLLTPRKQIVKPAATDFGAWVIKAPQRLSTSATRFPCSNTQPAAPRTSSGASATFQPAAICARRRQMGLFHSANEHHEHAWHVHGRVSLGRGHRTGPRSFALVPQQRQCGRPHCIHHRDVTSNATYHTPSSPAGLLGLVDGDFLNGNSSWFDPSGQTGIYIDFTFPNAKIVTEVKHYASSTTSHGAWRWQGSNDGIAYTDVCAAFSLSGVTAGATLGDLSGNSAAYWHYRLTQTADAVSDDPFLREFEFKLLTG